MLIKSEFNEQKSSQSIPSAQPKNLDLQSTKTRPPLIINLGGESPKPNRVGMANPRIDILPPVAEKNEELEKSSRPGAPGPRDHRFYYQGIRTQMKMNSPKTGREKLMSCEAITVRPKIMEKSVVEAGTYYWVFPGERCKEQMLVEPMFTVYEKTIFGAVCLKYSIRLIGF